MEPWMEARAWQRVAQDLRGHRLEGFGAVLTEDVLRFASARALATFGALPGAMAVERPHPVLLGSRVDLIVGDPVKAAIEFKYPREPNEKNAAWTMMLGEVLKDFYRLAVYPGPVARVFVLAATSRLRLFLEASGHRYGTHIDRDHVDLGPEAAGALPKTAARIIGDELAAHHVTADRFASIQVDPELTLSVYLVHAVSPPHDLMIDLAVAPVEDLGHTSRWELNASTPTSLEQDLPSPYDRRVTIWEQLAECVAQLDQPFRRSEMMGWFRRHHPEVNEASLAAHIQSATSNGGHATGQFSSRRPLLTRLEHGVYRRFEG